MTEANATFKQMPNMMIDVLLVILVVSLLPVTYLALTYPPVVLDQGPAHRIFYLHVPVAWVALYAPLISAVCGVLYLFTRKEVFDLWSYANAKLALLFSVGVVFSGSAWASTEWGTYWSFTDERLTSFAILFFCLVGYMLVRLFTDDPRRRASYAAFLAVLSAVAALLTWFVIRWIEPDLHPGSVLSSMDPKIGRTFWISVLAYHFLFLALLRLTVRHERFKRIHLQFEAQHA